MTCASCFLNPLGDPLIPPNIKTTPQKREREKIVHLKKNVKKTPKTKQNKTKQITKKKQKQTKKHY